MSEQSRPFAELPATLVEEILSRTGDISEALLTSFTKMKEQRDVRRQQLRNAGLLHSEAELDFAIPTTCGVDGAFAIERLLATDLVMAAAVAIEGLTPPSETRYWPEPRHHVVVETEAHSADTGTIARALMIGMELVLAVQAPHQVIFLDGSSVTPLIYFNQALNRAYEVSHLRLSEHLFRNIGTFLEAYQTVLRALRSDKCWASVPKYTTLREIGQMFGWPESQDDRSVLTGILDAGEYTAPARLQQPRQPWHLNISAEYLADAFRLQRLADDIIDSLDKVKVVYYRPNPALPALRLEISSSVADNPKRLGMLIYAAKYQCNAAAIMEPYPLYMADRMVKPLSIAVSTFRQVASQQVAEVYDGDITDVFLGLHGYRTESGR